MILLSKVDDRKIVLGLYTIAHEMINGQGYFANKFSFSSNFQSLIRFKQILRDSSFPRLGQMIVDYETPLKKLSEDFVPHSKLIYEAIQSLSGIHKTKNATTEELRRNLTLNLSASPNLMLQPPFTDTVSYLVMLLVYLILFNLN